MPKDSKGAKKNSSKEKATKSSSKSSSKKTSTSSARPANRKVFTDKSSASKEIEKAKRRYLAKVVRNYSVGSLEEAILRRYPARDAEEWDITGLTVGERGIAVKKVAVALDPTVQAIRYASKLGANVLVTHHPPYLKGPLEFSPESSVALSPGAGVWEAIKSKVALMNFHTALDVSKQAQSTLPKLLGFSYSGELLKTIEGSNTKGYGSVCRVPLVGRKADTLGRVAAKCVSTFGKTSKVWGDFSSPVRTCATVLGSSNSVAKLALEQGVDCLICGEIGYHVALDLSQAGLGIIELGHDVSELPLVAVLAQTLMSLGIAAEDIIIVDQSDNWSVPEAIRL